MKQPVQVKTPELVLLDYGGVLAEEGYKAGMKGLALAKGKNPEEIKRIAFDLAYGTGFNTGKIREHAFWDLFRKASGIEEEDAFLTNFVLERFTLRPFMLSMVRNLRDRGIGTGILSDQTHWLDELDERDLFFKYFDHVFNSFHEGMTKKEPVFFEKTLQRLGKDAESVLFVDDHAPHIERARALGMDAILYTREEDFRAEMGKRFPFDPFTSFKMEQTP